VIGTNAEHLQITLLRAIERPGGLVTQGGLENSLNV
jgi:hypothetical protein